MTRFEEVQSELHNGAIRWLVTGVAGFIGSNILELLLRLGQIVIGLDNFSTGYWHNLADVRREVGDNAWQNFSFIEGDVRNRRDCETALDGVDIVLHQAALGSVPRSINDPFTTHQVNVDGFLNMLMAARDAGANRFVFASSSSVYGDHEGLPKIEPEVGIPQSPYAVSKRACELYARTFFDHYGLETIGLRYFNVFGRRQDPDGAYAAVIPKWVGQMLADEPCIINGDGETSRDFCYVANVVQANLLAAFAPSQATGHVYNVAYGDRTTLNELHVALKNGLASVGATCHIADPLYRDFRSGDIRHSMADISRAVELLGYRPTYSVAEGIRETIAWYYSQHMAEAST